MIYDQFKKADAIVAQLKELYERQKQLKAVSDGKIASFEIQCMRGDKGEYPAYKIENLGHMQKQTELIQIFMQAAVLSLLSAYDREIQRLEKEFEAI